MKQSILQKLQDDKVSRRNFWNTDTQNPHFKWESGKEGEQTMVSEAES